MKFLFTLCCALLLAFGTGLAQQGKPVSLNPSGINALLRDAASQYTYMMKQLPADSFPRSYYPTSNKYLFSDAEWWCSGFYPGSLLLLYEQTGDTKLLAEAHRILPLLQSQQFNKGTHDLGFMMYCSFGNAFRLEKDASYKMVIINSAASLKTRFNEKIGCLRSWNNSNPNDFLVIIDNLMNLELLCEATRMTGDSSYYKVAVTHANTTIANHYRKDFSSWHVINYDPATGSVKQKRTAQGAADSSAWARGQSWGLYGFTMMYRETKDKRYLDQAVHIADYLLSHPRLPSDKIPYWDYDAPGIPNALRDASAASIMASALLELQAYHKDARYLPVAKQILSMLSSPQYRAKTGSNGGYILQHSVGSLPAKSEVDVPLTYADYYYIEALARLKKVQL
jgi:hypothetical protein